MAGGMSAGRGESLAQRTAHTRSRTSAETSAETSAGPSAGPSAAGSLGEVPVVRHCWYDGPHGRQAALLLTWRRTDDGWSGRIVVAAPDPSGWAIVEMWVEAGLLSPV